MVELNLTKGSAAEFINWLANDGYWGHTLTDFEVSHGAKRTEFIINGHRLSNYSNQMNHVVIDNCYEFVGDYGTVNGMEPLEYCLMKLGF